jgi:hypothetical protein
MKTTLKGETSWRWGVLIGQARIKKTMAWFSIALLQRLWLADQMQSHVTVIYHEDLGR